jgi:hypothetical protein
MASPRPACRACVLEENDVPPEGEEAVQDYHIYYDCVYYPELHKSHTIELPWSSYPDTDTLSSLSK